MSSAASHRDWNAKVVAVVVDIFRRRKCVLSLEFLEVAEEFQKGSKILHNNTFGRAGFRKVKNCKTEQKGFREKADRNRSISESSLI